MDFSIALPDFGAIADRAEAGLADRLTGGMQEATAGLTGDLRRQVVAAGLGTRLANSWRGVSYPTGGSSLSPAGYVYSNAVAIIDAFSRGATIRPAHGANYLWIPTKNVPRARRRVDRSGRTLRGGRMSPEEVENFFNGDLIVLRGRNGGLLAFIDVIAARNGAGFRGRTKGRVAQGRQVRRLLMFVLRRTVKLPKLIDPPALGRTWIGRLPGLVAQRGR
jgi:hypothetical protein